MAHVDELAEQITRRLCARTAAEWFQHLTPLGVPCGPVNDVAQAFELAAELGLEPRAGIAGTEPGSESMEVVANPIGLSATPPSYRRRSPRPGEHTDEIAAWLDS